MKSLNSHVEKSKGTEGMYDFNNKKQLKINDFDQTNDPNTTGMMSPNEMRNFIV
jgi:hypothetical protein